MILNVNNLLNSAPLPLTFLLIVKNPYNTGIFSLWFSNLLVVLPSQIIPVVFMLSVTYLSVFASNSITSYFVSKGKPLIVMLSPCFKLIVSPDLIVPFLLPVYSYSPVKVFPFSSVNVTLKVKFLKISPSFPPTVLLIDKLPFGSSFLMFVKLTKALVSLITP